MQHNARDPNRDHVHGRIFRVTYPSRPLGYPPVIDGAPIADLLENLTLPESRARYRTRRELREHDGATVASAAVEWAAKQDDERLKLEALWVTWGADQVDEELLGELLGSDDHRIRSAAVRVARFNEHQVGNLPEILRTAAEDDHGRVRLEAITAATYLDPDVGAEIVALAKAKGVDAYNAESIQFAENLFEGVAVKVEDKKKKLPRGITKNTPDLTTIQINCIVEGLKFDVKKVNLEAGKKVRLVFNNPDVMQHNLVVVKPGTADSVANAALLMGAEGFTKEFLPETDDIIIASKLLNANEKQVLTFTLEEPGTYPFVCTFPGHAMMMRGTFEVK